MEEFSDYTVFMTKTSEGHFEYKCGGEWSENIPTATNAGNYEIEYRLVKEE